MLKIKRLKLNFIVDYGVTPLACNRVQFKGRESFVGGVALGQAGLAVMNYTNPLSGSLQWFKSYFFFPNSYIVQFIGDIISTSTSPIVTTLDQRQLSGPVFIDGVLLTETRINTMARQVWHDRVGYLFVRPVNLTVDTSERQANWPAIGISLGNETHSIFAAYFTHTRETSSGDSFDYIAYIDIDLEIFNNDIRQFSPVQLNQQNNLERSRMQANVRGAFYGNPDESTSDRYISLAFLTAGEYLTQQTDVIGVDTDAPVLLQFQRKVNNQGWTLAAADPSHTLATVQVTVTLSNSPTAIVLNIMLPTGNWAGGSAVVDF